MKKQTKKTLTLKKETIFNLDTSEMGKLYGGSEISTTRIQYCGVNHQ